MLGPTQGSYTQTTSILSVNVTYSIMMWHSDILATLAQQTCKSGFLGCRERHSPRSRDWLPNIK